MNPLPFIKISDFGKGVKYNKSKAKYIPNHMIFCNFLRWSNNHKLDRLAVKEFKYPFKSKEDIL